MQLLAYALLDCDDAVWPYVCNGPRTRDLGELAMILSMMSVMLIQWASQGTDSAIAALEAGECIDTDDEGPGRDDAAISPSWLLSAYECKLDNSL